MAGKGGFKTKERTTYFRERTHHLALATSEDVSFDTVEAACNSFCFATEGPIEAAHKALKEHRCLHAAHGASEECFRFKYLMEVVNGVDNLVSAGNDEAFRDNEVYLLVLSARFCVYSREVEHSEEVVARGDEEGVVGGGLNFVFDACIDIELAHNICDFFARWRFKINPLDVPVRMSLNHIDSIACMRADNACVS